MKPLDKTEKILIVIMIGVIMFTIGFVTSHRVFYKYRIKPLLDEKTRIIEEIIEDCGATEECEPE